MTDCVGIVYDHETRVVSVPFEMPADGGEIGSITEAMPVLAVDEVPAGSAFNSLNLAEVRFLFATE
ncbi:hypothetical protein WT86_01200 [Burkholderia stagnalis]|uniref:Uncharacterized protein n=1 Tax=Burkholderia stagnalis TaxID=1503054 RepID=A0A106P2R4_9BURK|nr:hypothetical protein WT43_19205 [Burkholderia stagnalis]KWA59690.1 hypothetical protein WT44_19210 [Burkholderia stagnalis]KWC91342.1 hypothetical protein WT45_30205 [Burkholderia stagnalis]KWK34041.1 hypothetical protein WT79_05865 [Burkholderia stagnalis]KWN37730.1 hypothetical protein WT86_01200 [Burkholderia stagnalis]